MHENVPISDFGNVCADRNSGNLLQLECSEGENNDGSCFSLLFIVMQKWSEVPGIPQPPTLSWGHSWGRMRAHYLTTLCEPTATKQYFWLAWPTLFQKTSSICVSHSLVVSYLPDVSPKLLVNEDVLFPLYLCRWPHTPPFKPWGSRI